MTRYDDLLKRLDDHDLADGIYADKLRVIADVIDAIRRAEHSFDSGDLGLSFTGRLEVTVSEVDSHGDVYVGSGAELVGWITPVDTDWWFVPCAPQLHWSPEQAQWVELDVIRAENERRHTAKAAS